MNAGTENKIENKGEWQLEQVRKLLTVQPTLSRSIFDENEELLPEVAEKLLGIVDLVKKELLSAIKNYKVVDVVLCSQMCGYMYDEKSNLDMAIILEQFSDNLAEAQHILNFFSTSLFGRGFRFKIYGHEVNYFFMFPHELVKNASYSLINRRWIEKPCKREFAFTPEFCFRYCCELSAEIHRIVAALPKANEKFLTFESCEVLAKYLDYLSRTAVTGLQFNPEGEYCLNYNVYRCLKSFGTFSHFRQLIRDSRNYLVNEAHLNEK